MITINEITDFFYLRDDFVKKNDKSFWKLISKADKVKTTRIRVKCSLKEI